MRLPLLRTLLLPGLLTAYSGYVQGQMIYHPQLYQPQNFHQLYSPTQHQATRQIVVAPTIPIDADGSIRPEPDSATRHQYVRHRVRSVLKTRLNKQGEVLDTIEYLTIDEQGRWTQVNTWKGQVQRQWSYNSAGQCTALIEHPRSARPYTVISTYNPALQRGHQEVLQRNGTHTLVQEKQLYHSGDTLLTEIKAHELQVGNYYYPKYVQRSLRLALHPDTTLSLTYFYNKDQQISSHQFDYLLYQRGRLFETGKITLPKPGPETKAAGAAMLAPEQAVAALRRGTGLQPQNRRFYDSQRRLIREEFTKSNDSPSFRSTVRYTYNNLGQLIGRESGFTSAGASALSTYTVYSYLESGLLAGETTNARTGARTFYQYHYQYYD
ncbi:hypothetical protein [Hymenobacter cellulosivorans]|uniref:RHS repeat protein n=1 Tax=Hymenobacter cellulosivorans TaxID=2932249 RepID=A0ABY4FAY4_9BACT|nr:hypothetical protein [Hymenobacter cellulosivorans]UOQ53262.1 hypothetical protein MUN80_00535 [Hymenobacter cellulosivorans]